MVERDMIPWIPPILSRLIPTLLKRHNPSSLLENTAITIGRLSLISREHIAPHLSQFAEYWCETLSRVPDNLEKESAFHGFCALVRENPNGLANCFSAYCEAVVKWKTVPPELDESIREIILMFQKAMGEQWTTTKATYPTFVQQRLMERYGV